MWSYNARHIHFIECSRCRCEMPQRSALNASTPYALIFSLNLKQLSTSSCTLWFLFISFYHIIKYNITHTLDFSTSLNDAQKYENGYVTLKASKRLWNGYAVKREMRSVHCLFLFVNMCVYLVYLVAITVCVYVIQHYINFTTQASQVSKKHTTWLID